MTVLPDITLQMKFTKLIESKLYLPLDDDADDASGNGLTPSTETGAIIYPAHITPQVGSGAVQLAKETTNKIKNPRAGVNVTNWIVFSNVALTRETGISEVVGGTGFKAEITGNITDSIVYSFLDSPTLNAGQWFTAGVKIKGEGTAIGKGTKIRIFESGGASGTEVVAYTSYVAMTDEYVYFTCSGQLNRADRTNVYLLIECADDEVGDIIHFTENQVEENAYPTPYCDGSLGEGHSWSGTPHASTSSRIATQLEYATPINLARGTIAFSATLNDFHNWDFFFSEDYTNAEFDLYADTSGGCYFRIDNQAVTVFDSGIDAHEKFHVIVTWDDSDDVVTYSNGTEASRDAWGTRNPTQGTNLILGGNYTGTTWRLNGWLDEFIVLDYALTANEAAILYNEGQKGLAFDGVWTGVGGDVLTEEQFTTRSGIFGQRPTNRMSSPGILKFTLDNSSNSSGGIQGYYTPTSSNCRAGFANKMNNRLAIIYDSDTYYSWVGKISKITPDAGRFGGLRTKCVAQDWIGQSVTMTPEHLEVQTDQTGDQLLTTALTAVTNQPIATDFDTGKSTFAYAFDEIRDDTTTMHQLLKNITLSELGYIAEVSDTDTGGILSFWNRHARITSTDVLISMDDDGDFDFITLEDDERNILNIIKAIAYPRTVDVAADSLLWELTGDDITIPGGESVRVTGRYTDSNSPGTRIGGVEMVTPTTDHYSFTTGDANVTVVADLGGNSVVWDITNDGAGSGDITKLQAMGKRVLVYRPVTVEATDTDSTASFGDRKISLPLRYQNKMTEAQDFVDIILSWYKDETLRVKSVTFSPNRNSTLMLAFLKGVIGNRITLSEVVSGIESEDFFISGIRTSITEGNIIKVTWALMPASANYYWILGTSKLDTETKLAF